MSNKDLEWLFSKTRDKGYKYEGIAFTFADLDLFGEAIFAWSWQEYMHDLEGFSDEPRLYYLNPDFCSMHEKEKHALSGIFIS